MPNDHIDVNIPKTIAPATGTDISQNITARRAVASPVEPDNKRLDPPSPTYIH